MYCTWKNTKYRTSKTIISTPKNRPNLQLNDFKMGFATLWMTYIVRERAKKNMISGLLIRSDISGQCLFITVKAVSTGQGKIIQNR